MKTCTKCNGEKELSDFYASKTHSQKVMCYCKNCFNAICCERWRKRKMEAVVYKGGKCEDCNLADGDTHYAVFEFHHLDPKAKDFDWGKLRLRSWESIRKELDKCVLLCANCHRIRHAME